MPWLTERKPSWFRKFCCDVLRSGPIPRHVAFVMDGNRRFARKNHLRAVIEGHVAGFEKLTETLEWCRDLGITEVTVYAFSIENFKRSEDEVSSLMQLAVEKFRELLSEKETIEKYGVCIRFLGNLALLPLEIRRLAAEITLLTKHFNKAFFNVCIAYTSQDEITRAVQQLAAAVSAGHLETGDISADLLSHCLDTRHSPDPDILIRTSGEQRLSDFLLYQCAYSCLYFDDVLWPEFSFWNMCWAILHYQRHCKAIEEMKLRRSEALEVASSAVELMQRSEVSKMRTDFVEPVAHDCCDSDKRVQAFLKQLELTRLRDLTELMA